MQLEGRVVGIDDFRPDSPAPVVRKAPRPRRDKKRRAAECKHGDGQGLSHS